MTIPCKFSHFCIKSMLLVLIRRGIFDENFWDIFSYFSLKTSVDHHLFRDYF